MLEIKEFEFLGSIKRNFRIGDIMITDVEYHQPVPLEWHCHQNFHVTMILQGGCYESRKKRDIETLQGDVVLYNKYEPHRNFNEIFPSKNLNIEFKDTFFSNNNLEFDNFNQLFISNSDINFSLLKVYHECLINDLYSEESIYLSLLTLFDKHSDKNSKNNGNPLWLDTIREILRDRWNEFIPLQEFSDELKVHPVTISKYFPRYFDCTLGEYMRKIKIEKALELLKRSNSSLSEIAYICGFSDQSHFIRTFKYFTNFNPGYYRNI